MANILLRRLAERGWVKLTRLSSKSVRYALTPSGIGELARRTAGYFQPRHAQRRALPRPARDFSSQLKRNGVATIVLFGESEVELLLDYVCERHGIVFVRSADFEKARQLAHRSGGLLLIAEKETVPAEETPAESLALVLAGVAK